jgi:hypothetical protein
VEFYGVPVKVQECCRCRGTQQVRDATRRDGFSEEAIDAAAIATPRPEAPR